VRPVKAPKPAASISADSLLSAAQEGVGEPTEPQVPPAPDPQDVAPQPEMTTPPPEPPPPTEPPAVDPEPEREPIPMGEAEPSPAFAAEPEAPPEFTSEPEAPPDFTAEPEAPLQDELPPDAPAAEGAAGPFEAQPFEPSAPEAEPSVEAPDGANVEIELEDPAGDEGQPAVKRVQVSNQLDILAELDNLRTKATMANGAKEISPKPADDAAPDAPSELTRELTRNVEKSLNSDIFKNMRGMQLAVRIQDERGDTIHTLDPVSLTVDDAAALRKLCLRFELDLENLP
jgi:hypothetical protein